MIGVVNCISNKRVFFIKFALVLLLMLFSGSQLLFGQFYKDFSQEQRKKVAEAYYLVGIQHKMSNPALGKSYIDMAYKIYPELDPSKIQDEDVPAVPSIKAVNIYEKDIKLIEYRFKRLAGDFLAKNIGNMESYFDSVVYNGDFDLYTAGSSIVEEMELVLTDLDLNGMSVSDLFDLKSIQIKAQEGYSDELLVFALVVQAKYFDLNKYFPFWHGIQNYFWRQDSLGNWVIFAISSLPEASFLEEQKEFINIQKAIIGNFTACLEAFINEDLSGVMKYMAEDVELIKLGTSIKQNETEYTFSGFFEESDPPAVGNVNSLIKSVSLKYNEAYTQKYGGEVYILEVELNEVYAAQLSFWSSYKNYYFLKTGSGWKIRAIE